MESERIPLLFMLLALVAYLVGGGADFGGGVWDLLARGPRARRQRDLIAAEMGPVWEANHVWFVFVFVLLFSAFPPAFAAITQGLFGALTLYAFGIVLRGAAFTFQHYDLDRSHERKWGALFSGASIACPFLLGYMGALLLREQPLDEEPLCAFAIASGLFVLALCSSLAASYLAFAAREPDLARDFRARALLALVAAGALSMLALRLASSAAPRLVLSSERPWLALAIASAPALGLTALWALYTRRFGLARVASAALAAAVVIAWGLALDERIAPPNSTAALTRAQGSTLRFLSLGSIAGFVLLVPSLVLLFRVFRRR